MSSHNQPMKIAKNASWIIACRIIQAILSLVVSSLSARYLGPSNYGIINYAASLVAFALPITQLGLNCTLVKELVSSPDNEGEIMGTSLLLSFFSSLLSIGGIAAFVLLFNSNETITLVVTVLYSIMLIFQALELINYWYQAHYLSKYFAIVSLSAYVLISVYKVFLLSTQKSIEWFAVSNALDYLLISVSLIVIYYKLGGQRLTVSLACGKRLLKNSVFYIISGLMAVVYAQTDRIMIKNIIGDTANGYYSAAITCATLASFVFTAIVDSMRPYVFEAKVADEIEYQNRVKKLYSIVFYSAVLYSVFCFVFAKYIVRILYGNEYIASVSILRVLVWYAAFNYYGGAQGVWMLAENKQKYLMIFGTVGAIVNVLLNSLLIPIYNEIGAAVATLITAVVTNVVLCYVIKPTRDTVILLIQSLNPKYLLSVFKYFLSKNNKKDIDVE